MSHEEPSRTMSLKLFTCVLASIIITIAAGVVGWATNAYAWHLPLCNFLYSLMVISWVATIATWHLEASVRHIEEQARSLHVTTRKRIKENIEDTTAAAMTERQRQARAANIVTSIDRSERNFN